MPTSTNIVQPPPKAKTQNIDWQNVGIGAVSVTVTGFIVAGFVHWLNKRRISEQWERDDAIRRETERKAASAKVQDATHALRVAILPWIDKINSARSNLSKVHEGSIPELGKAANSFAPYLSGDALLSFYTEWEEYKKDRDFEGVQEPTGIGSAGYTVDHTEPHKRWTDHLEAMLKIASDSAKS